MDMEKTFKDCRADQLSTHHYGDVYKRLLIDNKPRIVLIIGGLGLAKACKKICPDATVHISRRNIQREECIRYGLIPTELNTSNPASSYSELCFDLIVDDNTHDPSDYLKAFDALRGRLAPGGTYVIEDIRNSDDGAKLSNKGFHVHDYVEDFGRWDDRIAVYTENNGATPKDRKINIITPTGDREDSFKEVIQCIHNQTVKPDKWIIVDDGLNPMSKDVLSMIEVPYMYIRETPMTKHSLSRNMRTALSNVSDGDIIIIEDDEWYGPEYIQKRTSELDSVYLTGDWRRFRYSLSHGGTWEVSKSARSACLHSTAFRHSLIPVALEAIGDSCAHDVDVRLWDKVTRSKTIPCMLVNNEKPYMVTMKAWPKGRAGTMGLHRRALSNKDFSSAKLREWLGDDAARYLKYVTQDNDIKMSAVSKGCSAETSLCFFTSVDEKYIKFVLPYIYFASKFNNGASFEIVALCSDTIYEDLCEKANKLSEIIGCKVLIRRPKTSGVDASKIRFIEEPETRCTYTYCGDVDILILEDITNFHITQMKLYGTIFDNIIRYNNSNSLSGLHFVKTDEYYQKTKEARRSADHHRIGDAIVLNRICENSGLKFRPKTIGVTNFHVNRPDHGFHISPNRRPFRPRSPIPIDLKLHHYKTLCRVLKSPEYLEVSKLFDTRFKEVVATAVDFIRTSKFGEHDPDDLVLPASDKKYVIYSCQIGDYERPIREMITDTDNFDYIYFTDNPNVEIDKVWKVIDIREISWIFPKEIENDNVRKARYIKTHPHLFFDHYQRSLWVDANMAFKASPYPYVQSLDESTALLSTVKHPVRDCIYDEASRVIMMRRDNKDIVQEEMVSLKHDLYPCNNGLIESNMLLRDHNNESVITVMEQWWTMIEGYSRRDQLSFDYIRWKNNFPINTITIKQRDEFVTILRHK